MTCQSLRQDLGPWLRGSAMAAYMAFSLVVPANTAQAAAKTEGSKVDATQALLAQVRQPFASTLIVKPDSLMSRGADGSVAMQMKAQDEPVLRTINAMLFAVMAADLAQLGQYFEVSGQVQGSSWKLHLVPRDAMLAQWLQAVDLSGQQFVQEVQLQETRGDRSLISIKNPAAEQALRGQDASLFE